MDLKINSLPVTIGAPHNPGILNIPGLRFMVGSLFCLGWNTAPGAAHPLSTISDRDPPVVRFLRLALIPVKDCLALRRVWGLTGWMQDLPRTGMTAVVGVVVIVGFVISTVRTAVHLVPSSSSRRLSFFWTRSPVFTKNPMTFDYTTRPIVSE